MAQKFLSGVQIIAGDENTLYLDTGATGQQTTIFYQVDGSFKYQQRVGTNWELYNYTTSSWDFHIQGSTGRLGLKTTSPLGSLHINNTSVTSDTDGTATMTASGQDSIILYSAGTEDNTYGSITWMTGSRRRAMITAVAENADSDFQGIAFYTRGTDGAGDMYETMRLKHNGTLQIGTLTSGRTGALIVNQEGGVTPVAKFMTRTNKAIVQVSDNDTTGYISSENGLFSIGRNGGVNATNININASHQVLMGASTSSFNDKLYIVGDAYTTGGWRVGTSATFVGKLINDSGKLSLMSDGSRDVQIGNNNTPNIIEIDTSAQSTTFTKQDGSPTINMLWDGNNPSSGTLLHYLNYKVDYNGTHQDWGGIEHRTTSSSSVRTQLNFNVKSQSGNVQNALTLQGQASAVPNAIFAGDVTGEKFILNDGFQISSSGTYGVFNNWVNVDSTGFYTSTNIFMDLDDSSSRFVVRGVSNTEIFEIDTSDGNSSKFSYPVKINAESLYGLTSTGGTNPKTELGGFITVPGPETSRYTYLTGVSENKLGGLYRKGSSAGYSLTSTKDGSTITSNWLENAFQANDNFSSLSSTTSSTVCVIEITVPTMFHGSNAGIAFSNGSWRAKDVKIEVYNGSSWSTIYDVTNSGRSTHINYFSQGSTGVTKLKYTLTNFVTTSCRISSIFANNYSGGNGVNSQLYADNTLYGNQTIQSGYSMYAPIYYETGSTTNYLDLGNTSTSLKVAGSLDVNGTGNNNFVGNIVIDNAAPILQANSSNAASGLRINVTGLDGNSDDLLRIQDAGTTRVELHKDGTFQGLTSTSFVKSGGTSSQYLMADGSVSTSAASTDDLDDVVERGAVTDNTITVNGLRTNADSTYDIGQNATRFATAFVDNIQLKDYIKNNTAAYINYISNQGHRFFVDANGDDTSHQFQILANTDTYAAGNVVFKVEQTGDATFSGDVYGKSVDGDHSKLYRFGGLFLTWDSDSYGTNLNHSITSTDNGTYSDSITINSFDKVRINIDSNSNDSASTFSIGRETTGTANTLLTVAESGNLTVHSGSVTVGSNTVINTARQGFFASLQHSGTISFLNGSQGTTGSNAQGINVGAVFASGSYNNTPGTGDVWAVSDMRAPIFYDYDDTNYYVDSASTSIVKYLGRRAHGQGLMVGGYNNVGASHAKTNPIFTIGSSYLPSDTALSNMYGIGYTRGDMSAMPGTSGWGMYVAADGNARIFLDGQNGGIGTASASWRAPIFYDSNNTTYYANPASRSNFGSLDLNSGVVWDATTQGTSKGSLHISPNTSTDHAGGSITWGASDTSSGTTGQAGIYVRSDGSYGTRMYLSTTDSYASGAKTTIRLEAAGGLYVDRGNLYSPLYYDKDNTNYFVNPASNSTLLEASIGTTSGVPGGYRLNMGGSIDMNNNSIDYLQQIHFNDNVRFYDDGNDSYLNFKFGDTSFGGIKMLDGSGNLHGYFYADGDDQIGILDSGGSWAVQVDNDNITALKVQDTYRLKCTTSEVHTYGNLHNDSSLRAPIFYDSNSTTYYCDPASSSTSLYMNGGIIGNASGERVKYSVWDSYTYGIGMKNGIDYGHIGSDEYAMTFQMNDNSNRGFWFGDSGQSDDQGAMSLTTNGRLTVATSISVGEGESVTSPSSATLYVDGTSTFEGAITIDSDGATDNYYINMNEAGSNRFTIYENSNNVYFNGWAGHTIFRPRMAGSGSFAVTQGNNQMSTSGAANFAASVSSPIFYDSGNTSFYVDPNATTSGYFNGELRTQNGNFVQDFDYRMYAGGGSYYGSGSSGWTRVAEVTFNGNCQAYYLAGKMWNRNYHEASSYDINICARSECDFTSNNESHFLEFAISLNGSQFTNYQNRIKAVLIAASTNTRTYEIQFHESAWNENWWQLWTAGGFTILREPAAPTSAASGTARLNHVSKLSSDSLYANTDTRSPLYYDLNNTAYYTNPAGTSILNDVEAVQLAIDDYIYHKGDTHTYFGFTGNDAWAMVLEGTTRLSVADSSDPVFTYNAHINMSGKDIDNVNQLHFQDNIRFVDMGNDQYLKFKWGDSNAGGIRFYDGDDTHHGYIYGDGSGGFGLLDKDSQWFLYTNGSSSTQLRCDNSVKIQLTTSETRIQNSTFYVNNTNNHNFGTGGTGNIYVGGNTSGQYFRIHHNNSSTYLDAGGAYIYMRSNNGVNTRFRFGAGTDGGTLVAAGDVIAYGSPSDITLKENIKPIENALDKVEKLQGVTFDWKEQDITNIKEDIGFIAQDVQEVLPELVRENDNGKLSMRHQGVIPVLVEAIKDLKAELDELKKQINNG